MIWLIVLAALVLLLLMPVGVDVAYNVQGILVRLVIGPLRFTLYPVNKAKADSKPTSRNKADNFESKADKTASKAGGKLTDFLPLVQLAIEMLGYLRRKLRVRHLEMKLILGGDDPCDLSINYGRAWAALGNIMPLLERVFVIQKRDLEVECDYTSSETTIRAHLKIIITTGRLLYIAAYFGVRGLREYLKIQNKRKGGAAT